MLETPDADLAKRPDLLAKLEELSSQFFADAAAVDAAATIPAAHLSALASAGLYGIFAPVSAGGLGLGYPEACAVVEELASSCVASTFVWVQHFRFLGAMLDPVTPAGLRHAFLAPAVRGEVKAGVAPDGPVARPSHGCPPGLRPVGGCWMGKLPGSAAGGSWAWCSS